MFCTCTLIKPLTSLNCSFSSCLVFSMGIWLPDKVPELHTQDFCVPVQWDLLSAGLAPSFGGEIKDLLHTEPWDCLPLPGYEAALVSSSPSFSSISWDWMLKLGAWEFSWACFELTHHRLGFGFSLPDQFSSFTPRFPFSHIALAMLKPLLWCGSNPSCSMQVFSLPVLPVWLFALGDVACDVVLWRRASGWGSSMIQMGRLLPPPCQV